MHPIEGRKTVSGRSQAPDHSGHWYEDAVRAQHPGEKVSRVEQECEAFFYKFDQHMFIASFKVQFWKSSPFAPTSPSLRRK